MHVPHRGHFVTKSTVLLVLLCWLCSAQAPVYAQQYSEWNQSSGFKKIEYRWKQDTLGCVIEYRNADEHDRRKYKSRVVYQASEEEHVRPYSIISFDGTSNPSETITSCHEITDVSVTRF